MKVINWNILYPEEDEKKKGLKFYFKKTRAEDDFKPLLKLLKKASYSKKTYSEKSDFAKGNKGFFSSSVKSFTNGIDAKERIQRCAVKMRYSNKIDSHKKFLKQYMTQENKKDVKNKPKIFGNDKLENYESRMVKKHFKFIISPESSEVPLKEFAYSYMDALSQMLNKKFDWQAVIHTNTEHPHLHILINGLTLDGQKLNRPFPPNFMKNHSRQIACDLLTKIIGERQTEDILLSREKSISALRFTNYDKEIENYLNEINSNQINKNSVSNRIQKRLSFLTENNIVSFTNNVYTVPENWKNELQWVGKFNTYLQAKESLKFTMPKDFSLFANTDEKISGELVNVYCMNDEDIWTNALVIENKAEKKAWYVPVYDSTEKYIDKVGKEISYIKKLNKGKYKDFINIIEENNQNWQNNKRPPNGGFEKNKVSKYGDKNVEK